ncbi:SIR2 family NAD-dependent protein deacylase [Treponema putidum]|uniref:Sir2 silent information regulator family NAD-dependent deacetylase n=1 Tax=Treponema putidum TaxID=221027 RepID=A0AAE9MW93_9SPIR|nr:Sir2 silent information regulator family NAD-dependent deacetylase [Treponema putidum]AIN93673.1 Sir2 silent information regulator family NAD-dependent deacetylase [Treponema putidum]TWI77767.1 NAD-dependent SIR2 family protein deacetylase [Treponema putidum]UTY29915.1 Sir2 silent information regulator family NAD-dependent deacetylase [Treponema putidum]UTY34775.1 Sir2 silent information regulator family NAD-dependent deacetylase [Treponema putidum]
MTEKIEKLKQILSEAKTVVIGAGSGLSTSAGFTYSGERFEKYFSDFAAKYGFHDMYSGGFTPFESLEERWAYWSRYIMINRYMNPPKPVYEDLFSLVKDKDYFVLTTNVDHCFQKAGFDKERLFYTQGDYGLFQCSEPCHEKTYDNEKQIRAMWEFRQRMEIPAELVPHCPVCGKPMSMNLRADITFVTDKGWHKASKRYENFLQTRNIISPQGQQEHQADSGKVLFLELGVGGNTPGIIKYPFWQMTLKNLNADYACINFGEAVVPLKIENQSICINEDIGEVLKEIKAKR